MLVATDVAARGLDLPDLALVIHADLPNDSETLLHRSGRTGRAGKKGLCTLIVPFNRRRKAETLLNDARIRVTWGPAPTADEIRARDQERFLADAIFTEPATEDELALAHSLQQAQSVAAIALALVRMQRARLPAPEDLSEDTGPPRRDDRAHTGRERHERQPFKRRGGEAGDRSFDRGSPRPRPQRPDSREMVWFRLNIGRERNADPRWLLPLICKAGDVSKAEIGAIKIFDRDTRFEIVAEHADRFAEAVRANKPKEGNISRVDGEAAGETATTAGERQARHHARTHRNGIRSRPRTQERSAPAAPGRVLSRPPRTSAAASARRRPKPASKFAHKKKRQAEPSGS